MILLPESPGIKIEKSILCIEYGQTGKTQHTAGFLLFNLTLLHPERPKRYGVLTVLIAIGLKCPWDLDRLTLGDMQIHSPVRVPY